MSARREGIVGLHQGQPVLAAGATIENACAGAVLVHGRGASAADILTLVPELNHPGFHYLAPQAAGGTWYPHSFLAPVEMNEPGLSSGLAAIGDVLTQLEDEGVPAERTLLLGFSQGACLALEYAARHQQRYGGIACLSGALITLDHAARSGENVSASLAGTPVFFGCSDVDAHIPRERVEESAEVMERLGGEVTLRLYRGMGHTINKDEITFVREMMSRLRGEDAG